MSLFTLAYLQRAALACALIGLAAPAVGVFVVQRRLSLLGDGIGHVAFAGAALGVLTGTAPVATAAIAAVAGAVAIEWMRSRGRESSDVALAVMFYGGISSGVLIASLARTSSASLLGYLFGSVLTVTPTELVTIAVLAVAIVGTMWGLRRALFAVCYDEDAARVSGLPVRALNLVLAGSAAATVAVAMRVVGALLIAALMVLPVATALRVTRSFRAVFVASLGIGVAVSLAGLSVSVAADSAPGATIVVTAIAVLLGSVFAAHLLERRTRS